MFPKPKQKNKRPKCGHPTKAGATCPDPSNGASGLCTNHAAMKWNELVKAGFCVAHNCFHIGGELPDCHPPVTTTQNLGDQQLASHMAYVRSAK